MGIAWCMRESETRLSPFRYFPTASSFQQTIMENIWLLFVALVPAVAAQLPPGVRPVVCKPAAAGVTACLCKQGYIQNPNSALECTDFDECAYYASQGLDLCRAGVYGRCVNEIGDYRCQCDSRYYTTSGSE